MILEKVLTRATSQDGTISYSKMAMQLNKAGSSASKMVTTLAAGGQAFEGSLNAANLALATANRSAITLNKTFKEVSRVMVQSFKFTAAQTVIREVTSNVQSAIRWVKELNAAVNDIAVVTGRTGDEITQITEQVVRGSKALKVAAKDYAEGALIFYQQGLNDNEVTRRNEITIKASLAANQSIAEMSKQLTAIWNTYGMVGKEQERAASVGAALAASTAVDFKDIAEAMQSAAAPAAQMGVEYNQLAAIIATVGDVTQQSASTIGNAYKTIFSRFQQLRAEGTDGEVTLSSVSKQLESMGVHVLDAAGNLRELGVVINEVGENWDNWTQTQQTAIAQIVGGTRQYGQFLALMQNFDKYQKNLATAQGEDGSVLEQQYTQALDSVQHKAEVAAEAWRKAFGEAIPEESLKNFYDLSLKVADVFGNFLKGMGGLPGILTTVGIALSGRIVPALITGAKQAKVIAMSLTPHGRERSIKNDYSNQRASIDSQYNNATSKLEKESLTRQREKLRLLEQIALKNEQINTKLKTATEEERVALQMQQERLKHIVEQDSRAVDEQFALGQELQLRKDILSVISQTILEEKEEASYQQEKLIAERDILQSKIEQQEALRAQGKPEYNEAALTKYRQELDKVNEALIKLEVKLESLNELSKTAKVLNADASARDLKNLLTLLNQLESGVNSIGATATQQQNVSKQELNLITMKITDFFNRYKTEMTQAGKSTAEVQGQLNGWRTSLEKIYGEAGLGGVVQEFSTILRNAGLINDELDEMASKTANLMSERQRNMEGASGGDRGSGGDGGEEAGSRFDRLAANESITVASTVGGITQVAFAINGCVTAWNIFQDTLNNTDLSTPEKMVRILGQLPMVFMSIQSGLAGLNAAAKGVGKAIGLVKGALGVTAGVAGGIVAAVVAATAAVGFGIYKMWKAWHDAQPEVQLEKAQKAAEAAREEYNRLKQEVEDTKAAFEDYDSVVKTLSECTYGTEEWRDALEQVNTKVLELLTLYPELSKYVYRGDNGELLIQQEGIDNIISSKKEKTIAAAGSVVATSKTKREKEEAVSLKNIQTSEIVKELSKVLTNGGAGSYMTQMVRDNKYLSDISKFIGKTGDEIVDQIKSDYLSKYNNEHTVGGEEELEALLTGNEDKIKEYADQLALELQEYSNQVSTNRKAIEAENEALMNSVAAIKGIKVDKAIAGAVSKIYGKQFRQAQEKYLKSTNLAGDYIRGMGLKQGDYSFVDDKLKIEATGQEMTNEMMAAALASKEIANNLQGIVTTTEHSFNNMSGRYATMLQTGGTGGLTQQQFTDMSAANTSDENLQEYLVETVGMSRELAKLYLEDVKAELTQGFEGAFDSIPEEYREQFKQLPGITMDNAKKIGDALKRTMAQNGKESADALARNFETLSKWTKDAEKQADILDAITGVDWSADGASERALRQLQKMGIVIEATDKDWQHFTKSMQDAYNKVPDITQLTEDLSKLKDLKDVQIGSIISEEDYNTILNYNSELMNFFVKTLDGYQMIGDALDYINGISNSINDALKTAVDDIADVIKETTEFLEQGQKIGTLIEYDDSFENGFKWYTGALDRATKWLDDIGYFETEAGEELKRILEEDWENGEEVGKLHAETIQRVQDAINEQMEKLQNDLLKYRDELAKTMNSLFMNADSAEERENLYDVYSQSTDQNVRDQAKASYGHAAQAAMNQDAWDGLDPEKVKAQAEVMAEALDMEEDAAQDVARVINKMNKGIDSLSKNWKDWSKIIKKATKEQDKAAMSSEEFAEAVIGAKTALSDILDVSEDFISLDFISTSENMELIEKAAKGDAKAVQALGIALSKNILDMQIKDQKSYWESIGMEDNQIETKIAEIQAMHDEIVGILSQELPNMQLGEVISGEDMNNLIQQMNDIVTAAGMTVEEANAYYRSLGFTPEFEMINVTDTAASVPVTTTWHKRIIHQWDRGEPIEWEDKEWSHTEQMSGGEITEAFPQITANTHDGKVPQVPGPKIKSLTYTGGGGAAKASSVNNGGGSKGGGGGSGSKKNNFKKKEKPKESEPLEKRYANIESSINKNTRALERLSEAEDDAWGAAKYKNLQKINTQLSIQGQKTQVLLKEARDYLQLDQAALQQKLASAGLTPAVFNSDGFVANWENIIAQINAARKPLEDALNKLIDQYNAGGVENEALELQIEEAEKALSDFDENTKDAIVSAGEQVDETAQKVFDTMSDLINKIREALDNWISKQRIKLDLRIDINEQDIRDLEHLNDLWGEMGTQMQKNWKNYQGIVEANIGMAQAAIGNSNTMWRMLKDIDVGDADSQKWFKASFGEEAYNEWIEGNGKIPESVISQIEEDVDAMQNYRDAAQEALRSMMEEWLGYLESVMDDFDKLQERLQANQETLDMWSSVILGLGMESTVEGSKAILATTKASYDTAKKTAQVYRDQALTAKAANEDASNALKQFTNMHGGANFDINSLTENELIQYQEILKWVDESDAAMKDAESAFKSAVTDMVDKMGEVMEAETQRLRTEFFDKINSTFEDFDQMETIYDMLEDQTDLTLDDLTKNYELDKLMGEINKYIEDSVDLSNMEEYNNLLTEIQQKMESGEKLNETDLETLRLKFQLMQDMDAWEEAKNNKNTMRLARDASGNYSYVYSGDQSSDSGEDNIQKLKDLMYEFEKLQQDAADEMEDQWLHTYATIGRLEEERNTAKYQSDAKYRAHIDEQLRIERENLAYYAAEIDKRYGEIEWLTQQTQDETSRLHDAGVQHRQQVFTDSNVVITMNTGETFTTMKDFHDNFVTYMDGYSTQLDTIGNGIVTNFNGDVEEVGTGLDFMEGDYTDLAKLVSEKAADIENDNAEVGTSVTDLRNTGVAAFDDLTENLMGNANLMVTELNNVTAAIKEQIAALQELRREQLAEAEKEDPNEWKVEDGLKDDYTSNDAGGTTTPPLVDETPTSNGSPEKGARVKVKTESQAWASGVSYHGGGFVNNGTTTYKVMQVGTGNRAGQVLIGWPNYQGGWDDSGVLKKDKAVTGWIPIDNLQGYATGGLVTEEQVLRAGEKGPELILNAEDTKNILAAVAMMRRTVMGQFGSLNGALAGVTNGIAGAASIIAPQSAQSVDQNVRIEASFPGVSVAGEIEEALNSLITQAAQYNIKK